MKRAIILSFVGILIITGCGVLNESISLMEYGEYAKITKDNIKGIKIIRYTEGGDETSTVSDDAIIKVYNNLKKKKMGKETGMTCDDNTTVYIFTLIDGTEMTIEIECGLAVIGNKRYVLK